MYCRGLKHHEAFRLGQRKTAGEERRQSTFQHTACQIERSHEPPNVNWRELRPTSTHLNWVIILALRHAQDSSRMTARNVGPGRVSRPFEFRNGAETSPRRYATSCGQLQTHINVYIGALLCFALTVHVLRRYFNRIVARYFPPSHSPPWRPLTRGSDPV